MDKFVNWYNEKYVEITWFIIGILVQAFLLAIASGNGIGALIDAVLIYINYYFYKTRV